MALPSRSSPRPGANRPFPALAGNPSAKADENPAAVYLAALADGPGRVGMRSTLDRIAALAGFPDAAAVPWREFRFQHVSAVRAAATLAPATANKYVSALRGVLKAGWRLGQIDTEDYMRAVDVPPVRGSRLPSGRALRPPGKRSHATGDDPAARRLANLNGFSPQPRAIVGSATTCCPHTVPP